MKICVAEDDAVYRRVLEAFLTEWGYDVVATEDGEDAWRVLSSDGAPRMAIVDWMMPGLDGYQLCQKVRQLPEDRYVYIVLLTARDTKVDIIRGLQGGADDYLVKPFDPPELLARLHVGQRLIAVQQELIAARESMRDLATRDALTGVWNRRCILETLDREVHRAVRDGQSVGVVLADLDHFKQINDTAGHLAGDATLREVARKIEATLRPYDSVGRYGGEEFLLVLPGCDIDDAVQCAERVRLSIASKPVKYQSQAIAVTASLGVACYGGETPPNVSAVLQAADCTLYQAKERGRNCVGLPKPMPSAGE